MVKGAVFFSLKPDHDWPLAHPACLSAQRRALGFSGGVQGFVLFEQEPFPLRPTVMR